MNIKNTEAVAKMNRQIEGINNSMVKVIELGDDAATKKAQAAADKKVTALNKKIVALETEPETPAQKKARLLVEKQQKLAAKAKEKAEAEQVDAPKDIPIVAEVKAVVSRIKWTKEAILAEAAKDEYATYTIFKKLQAGALRAAFYSKTESCQAEVKAIFAAKLEKAQDAKEEAADTAAEEVVVEEVKVEESAEAAEE